MLKKNEIFCYDHTQKLSWSFVSLKFCRCDTGEREPREGKKGLRRGDKRCLEAMICFDLTPSPSFFLSPESRHTSHNAAREAHRLLCLPSSHLSPEPNKLPCHSLSSLRICLRISQGLSASCTENSPSPSLSVYAGNWWTRRDDSRESIRQQPASPPLTLPA